MADVDGFSLINYLADVTNTRKASETTQAAIDVALGDIATQTTSQVDAVTRLSEASQQVVAIKNQITMEGEAGALAAIATANLDPTKQANFFAQTHDFLKESRERSWALKQEINKRQTVDFFTNPLEYVAAQITLPGLITKYNAEVTDEAKKEAELAASIELTTREGVLMNNAKRSTNLALAEAEAKKIGAKAEFDVAGIKIEGIKTNMDGWAKLQQARNSDISVAGTAQHVILGYQQFQLSQENAGYARAQREEMIRMRREKMDSDTAFMEDVNNGLDRLGKPRQKNIAEVKLLFGQKNFVVEQALIIGQSMRVEGTTDVPLAPTSGDAARLVVEGKAFGAQASMPGAPAFLFRKAYEAVEADPLKQKLKPEEKFMHVGSAAETMATNMLKVIKFEDKSNIYQAPPISVVYQAAPDTIKNTLNNNWFYKESIKPLGDQLGMQQANPETVLRLGITQVKNDPKNLDGVVDGIRSFYAAAARINDTSQNYSGLRLPSQVGYNVDFEGRRFNLMNALDIKRLLMEQSFRSNAFTLGLTGDQSPAWSPLTLPR